MISANDFELADATVTVATANGRQVLPALWLRERTLDEAARDATTGQRFFNPHELPADLSLTDVAAKADGFTATFSDGFTSDFRFADLALGIDGDASPVERRSWLAEEGPGEIHDWQRLEASAAETRRCLGQFLERGFVILRNTPTERNSILSVARHFGFVRETNFGSYFEVYSRPVSNDLAYRPVPLAPHTDNPYRDPVPGIQLLHCLVNETTGGQSTLVDSLSVCERMRKEDPDGYRLLTEIPVGFRFRDPDTHLYDRHPMIETDHDGCPTGIHYSPRLDETPLLDAETMVAFHRARQRLGQLLGDARFELRFTLKPGELMMFDNNRVLHGRTGYDPSEGMRHLQGCYIDRDAPESLYRMLSATKTERTEAA
ncbi:TauD/TfdA family dioxygenase [Pararhizobium mangrovi]|nr:TauD/TfdA family dioxygenase [Pararhizobium mangrovi]